MPKNAAHQYSTKGNDWQDVAIKLAKSKLKKKKKKKKSGWHKAMGGLFDVVEDIFD